MMAKCRVEGCDVDHAAIAARGGFDPLHFHDVSPGARQIIEEAKSVPSHRATNEQTEPLASDPLRPAPLADSTHHQEQP